MEAFKKVLKVGSVIALTAAVVSESLVTSIAAVALASAALAIEIIGW